MKKILVPCNFSDCSYYGLTVAIALSEKTGAEIIVLTVINHKDACATQPIITSESATSKFEKMISRLSLKTVIVYLVKNGSFLQATLECIKDQNIDLIVMGTRGSRGWDQFFLGSNVEKIIRSSPVPVLALKENLTINKIQNIVFPFGQKNNQYNLIAELKYFQWLFNARIHMLHVCNNEKIDPTLIQSQMQQFALKSGLQNYTLNVRGDPDIKEGIISFSKDKSVDLIMIPTHTPREKNLYSPSIAADLVNHSPFPIWTFPVKNKTLSITKV